MDLSKIISVAGKSGLFRVVAQGRQAIIAESLEDGKRLPIPSSVRVSTLDEISMFTKGDDVKLAVVLEKMHELQKGGASADPKEDVEKLYTKLGEALPDMDRERIYPNDVRKFFLWYALLLKSGQFTVKEEKKEAADGEKPKEEAKKKSADGTKGKPKVGGAAKKGASKGTSGPPKAAAVRRGGQRGS